jgi:DNA replication protein DnaC
MSGIQVAASRVAKSRFDEQNYQTNDAGSTVSPTTQSILTLLHDLGLHGMAESFRGVNTRSFSPDVDRVEWLASLLEYERESRAKKQLERRSKTARLRHAASLADADRLEARGLDSVLFHTLTDGEWIRAKRNILIAGTVGVGKTWLASALGQKALEGGFSVVYYRASRLFTSLASARADGRYDRMLRSIARIDLLILDDLGPERLDAEQRRDLLEIVEDRDECRSTIAISQLPVDRWYGIIGEPTIAVAVFDRLVHNAHRIELAGESLRKWRSPS